jgi:DNA-binding PadR family transcriptional regulator
MRSPRRPSSQAIKLLASLLADARSWRYGYDVSKETGLTPGTLYPLLERLEKQGLLESEWRPSEMEGRPPRHAYRLTRAGAAFAGQWTGEPDAAPRGKQKPALLKPGRG